MPILSRPYVLASTLLACLGLFACNDRDANTTSRGQGGISPDLKTGESDESTSTSEDSTSDLGSTVPGASGPDATLPNNGCRGIDFLVVVDNSGSMQDEQSNLINSFPGFLETITAAVKASQSSFHILVTDSDSDGCQQYCKARPTSTCPTMGIPCEDYDANAARTCDITLGAGRTKNGAGQACGVKSGRFLSSDDGDVSETFRCLGSLGLGGDYGERVMQAASSALSPELLGPQGCNEGFLRKDALLVLLFVTDEEDSRVKDEFEGSQGDPKDWYDSVLAAKGGDKNAVVAVGLVGDIGTKDPVCEELHSNGVTGAEASPRLREFVGMFGKFGRWGSVCAPDYNPFLQDVVSLVSQSCDEFEPPPQ